MFTKLERAEDLRAGLDFNLVQVLYLDAVRFAGVDDEILAVARFLCRCATVSDLRRVS